jgi:class 3 adenylate cyclase/tetratricopeptide (TPR) repeat protein
VTVLFGELVADVAEPAEPETLHALIEGFVLLAEEEVDRFGGTMIQLLGQGFMALFGAPTAHEDHPRRATLAALELCKRLDRIDLGGRPLAARLAMSAGPVVIGGPSGTTVGAAVDRARRLIERAEPGAILASAETAALISPEVELQALAPPERRDARQSEPAWRVVAAASPYASTAVAGEDHLGPFVGRAREMAVLEELREQAEASQGQVAGIAGEAGAGKSRLLLELSRVMRDRPHSRLRGHCLAYTSGIPCFPFIDMIRRASRIDEGDPSATVAVKLRRSLEAVGREVEDHLPLLLHLLGFGDVARRGMPPDPRNLQVRTFTTMRRMVLAASRRSLVVMEVEDLHWIDDTSQEFLESLIEEIGGARVLLLLTYRSGYQPRWLTKSFASQIVMRRLSAADSETVVTTALRGREIGADAVRGIVERAEGNPFFLEELALALGDAAGSAPETPVPATVQGVLMARIDRLPEAQKHLLQLASVLGREPSVDLLERIWDRDEPLLPLLAGLQRRELLYSAPEADREVYTFKHSLIQTVAYESLLKSRRRALHARAAAALETLYAGRLEEVYDRLAYHYPRAGEPGKTVHYLSLFAARAAAGYAHAEAAKALSEALEHAHALPTEVRDRRVVEILLQLAESLLPLARLPATLEAFERHREHLEGVEEPSLVARCHFWLAHTHSYLGNSEAAREHAEASIAAAQQGGDEATEGKARYVLGRAAFWAGQGSAGLEQSLRAVVLLERSDEAWWQGQAYWVAGFHRFALGQLDEALEAFHRACAIGEALDDYRLDASWSIGHLHACQGRHDEAVEFCRRGVERSKDPLNTAVATGFLGFSYLAQGDARAAVDALREAGARLAGTGMRQLQAWFAAFLAEAHLALGRPEEAREAGTEGLEIARSAGFPYGAGLALRALGRIALAGGDREQAAARLGEAEATFASIEAPFQLAWTRLDLARVAHASGDPAAAAALLGEADQTFARLGLAAQREQVAGLAGELGLPAPVAATP